MERYVEQLIEDLRAAHKPEGIPNILGLEGSAEKNTTMVQLTGIEPVVFPPVEKLSEPQLQRLSEELIALIESYNYIINLPQSLPAGVAYQKLLSRWSADIPYIHSGLSALGWMFCEMEPETCDMHEWCDWLTCEMDPETFPVYNGIYDDKGNKIDILDIPIPDLCISCKSFLDDDWEENLLCNMTRAGNREEKEEFKCAAWRENKNWETI